MLLLITYAVFVCWPRFTGIVALVVVVLRLIALFAPLILPFVIFTQREVHEASFYMAFWGVCLLVHILLIGAMLQVAQRLAVRQRALPPLKVSKPEWNL